MLVHESERSPRVYLMSRLLTLSTVSLLLGAVAMILPERPMRAGGADANERSTSDFVRQTQRALKEIDHRLSNLVRRVLDEPDSPRKLREQLMDLRFAAKSAEMAHIKARSAREIAEIAVKEYTAGTYPRDLQVAESEIAQAKSELELSQAKAKRVQEAWDMISKIRNFKSATDLAAVVQVGEIHSVSSRQALASKFLLEMAEEKKKVLVKYTRDYQTKTLQADAKKAHAEELAQHAAWELQKAKVEAMERDLKKPWPSSELGRRLLALIDQAVPMEQEAHERLNSLAKAEKPDAGLKKELSRLTNNLESILDEAEALQARDELSALSGRLRVCELNALFCSPT